MTEEGRDILSVRSRSCAAVVNICGGRLATSWGGAPGKTAAGCPAFWGSLIERFSILRVD